MYRISLENIKNDRIDKVKSPRIVLLEPDILISDAQFISGCMSNLYRGIIYGGVKFLTCFRTRNFLLAYLVEKACDNRKKDQENK